MILHEKIYPIKQGLSMDFIYRTKTGGKKDICIISEVGGIAQGRLFGERGKKAGRFTGNRKYYYIVKIVL
jgi:hypothetical protein